MNRKILVLLCGKKYSYEYDGEIFGCNAVFVFILRQGWKYLSWLLTLCRW